ncbi:hypothetical protein [Gorillibacterium sp. sgz5001074]|uniref:hypothetical protein n=1 Tax=Gorillibacterium sp. sgz5001074 TaxID=3446695 RepID=UPI003F680D68
MRTEQQVKRKLNELAVQRKQLADRLISLGGQNDASLQSQLEQLDAMVTMLEWVLHEPTGSYHV